MYSFENYLDEDLLNEDLLNEDLLESYSEDSDEDFDEARKRRAPLRNNIKPLVRPKVNQRSNFGKNLSGRSADYATKSDLKKALDSISSDVNELKKTSISTNKALTSLDAKHTELAKIDARKNENQTKVLKNMQMMNMMSSMLVQPKIKPENLEVIANKDSENHITSYSVKEKTEGKSIETDQTMAMMLPMITTMGDSGSGKSDNSSMMLPLMLIMNNDKSKDSNSMMPIMMMMMMQNK